VILADSVPVLVDVLPLVHLSVLVRHSELSLDVLVVKMVVNPRPLEDVVVVGEPDTPVIVVEGCYDLID